MRILACSLAIALLGAEAAFAVVTHNTPLLSSNFINGSGNANGGFTIDQNNGVELGLRAKVRYDLVNNQPQNVFTNDGAGNYFMPAGAFNDRARWNFEWSINTNASGSTGWTLDDLTYRLDVDFNPAAGTTYFSYDPIHVANPNGNAWWDHSMGNNSTTAANDVVATNGPDYNTYLSTYNVAQNSVNYAFIDSVGTPAFAPYSIDFSAPGTYTIQLTALQGMAEIAQSMITVNAVAVPEAGAFLLVGATLATGGGFYAFRRRRKAA